MHTIYPRPPTPLPYLTLPYPLPLPLPLPLYLYLYLYLLLPSPNPFFPFFPFLPFRPSFLPSFTTNRSTFFCSSPTLAATPPTPDASIHHQRSPRPRPRLTPAFITNARRDPGHA